MKRLFILMAVVAIAAGCEKEKTPGRTYPPDKGDVYYPEVQSDGMPARDELGNIIPDFSRVGYRWGDEPIPEVPVVKELNPPANGADARSLIQDAINEVSKMPLVGRHRGAILLKKGIYNVSSWIRIEADGVVLRGEGYSADENDEGATIIVATGTTQHDLIQLTSKGSDDDDSDAAVTISLPPGGEMNIKDDYVPMGRFWVRVTNPDKYSVGDQVALYRSPSAEWISDIRMDRIPMINNTELKQWDPEEYVIIQERFITMIRQDTLHFENPCVMAIETKYGGGAVAKITSTKRIKECGIENMLIRSVYKSDDDEKHGWRAIRIHRAEHCWVRNVHSEYFGYGLAEIYTASKNITVTDCECRDPKSEITGSRRYAFSNNGQLSLFINCKANAGRHDYVTGPRNAGPNVFVNCVSVNLLGENGPHQRWNSGTLYDNIVTDGNLNIYDHGNEGTGQGWAGANQVMWNCSADRVICQSPWASAKNYSIGTVARKHDGKYNRPDGVWISHNNYVTPQSLYMAQLELRRKESPGGVFHPATR